MPRCRIPVSPIRVTMAASGPRRSARFSAAAKLAPDEVPQKSLSSRASPAERLPSLPYLEPCHPCPAATIETDYENCFPVEQTNRRAGRLARPRVFLFPAAFVCFLPPAACCL
jgi:hypothetical protein